MNLLPEQEYHLRLLLNHLENSNQQGNEFWQDWQITRLDGGGNNRLFRTQHALGDFVVKFTIRDDRNRAEREFQALSALKEVGLQIAPMPLLVDTSSYRQPVVVQTWIEGDRFENPPTTDDEWRDLLQHFMVIRTVTPDTSHVQLPKAYSASSVAEGRSLVNQQLAQIPQEARPASLQKLCRRFEQTDFLEWENAPVSLCRIDPKPSNFIRSTDGLISVDWEYSGWGDPAYEIADMMAHPAYLEVPSSRWAWISQTYDRLTGDPTGRNRIGTYYRILVIWWMARFSRYLYQMDRGVDKRLASPPANWKKETQAKFDHYLNLAELLYPLQRR